MPTNPDPRLPVNQAARLFALLADETRLRLLGLLRATGGREGVASGDLAKAIRMSESALSHQLQRLRLAGVVTCRREGQNVFYSLGQGPARDILRDVLP